MRKIINISLFLLDSCKVGCKGCYAVHPTRDRAKVLDNFRKAVEYFTSSDLLTFSPEHEITVNLETSGLFSSNRKLLLSSDFIRLLDSVDSLRDKGYRVELENTDIITPKSWMMVDTCEMLLDRYGLMLDVATPVKRYWNGVENISVPNAVPQGGMGWLSKHIKLNYIPIQTSTTPPSSKFYIYNQYGCDLGSGSDTKGESGFESNNYRYRDDGIWNEYTYHLMIDDQAFYLCPLLHHQGKLLRSVRIELTKESIQDTIILIDTKYKV